MPPIYSYTSKWGFHKLSGLNPGNLIDDGIGALADDIDAIIAACDKGVLASRPVSTLASPGKFGHFYLATDDLTSSPQGTLYFDTGTSWLLVPSAVAPQVISEGSGLAAATTLSLGSTKQETWLTGVLVANTVVTVTNRVAGSRALLLLKQDATGSRTLTVSDGTTLQPVTVNSTPGSLTVVWVSCPNAADVYVTTSSGAAGATGAAGSSGGAGVKSINPQAEVVRTADTSTFAAAPTPDRVTVTTAADSIVEIATRGYTGSSAGQPQVGLFVDGSLVASANLGGSFTTGWYTDGGFQVYQGGSPTDPVSIGGGFMRLDNLTAGVHVIELRYATYNANVTISKRKLRALVKNYF